MSAGLCPGESSETEINKADTNELTEYWHRETRYVNEKVDEAFKDVQDHAYALGLKRGKEEVTALARRLVAARDAEDQREWVAILDALYKVGAGDTANLCQQIRSAQIESGENAVVANLHRMGLV